MPTCIDCHGVHNIQDPTTATFRNSTPYLCAKCHTDNALMQKYGLSTRGLNTYVADFHGTTVVLFDKTFPDQPTNKPVCTDCHGFHDVVTAGMILKRDWQVRENLLARCQTCHPDATANFPDAWLSHYIPSPEKYLMVYYINLFYKFFIPGCVVPMVVLVVMDFSRMMINRFRKPKPVTSKQSSSSTPQRKQNRCGSPRPKSKAKAATTRKPDEESTSSPAPDEESKHRPRRPHD